MNHFGTLLPFATSVKTNLTKIMIFWQEILKQSLLTAYIVYFTRKEEDRPNVIRHVWHVRKMSNNYSHSHGEPEARGANQALHCHARRLPAGRGRGAIVHTSAPYRRARVAAAAAELASLYRQPGRQAILYPVLWLLEISVGYLQ